MTETLKPSEQNLIWIDLEMTGLFPDTDRIIEVAVVVTDPLLTVRIEGPVFAVHQTDAMLDGMDSWNKGTHGRSGLTERVRASIVDEASAEAQVITFLQQYVPKGKSPMCGNSICQDRRFLDVSTLKELARRWKPAALEGFKKAQAHTAMADIHESIEELLHYRTHLLAV